MGKKVIRLTEKDLMKIVESVIKEQGSADRMVDQKSKELANSIYKDTHKYRCVKGISGNAPLAVNTVINTEKIDPLFVRHAFAILGRESAFGAKFKSNGLPTKYSFKWDTEYAINKLRAANDSIANIIDFGAKLVFDKDNWVPSMGIAQMTPDLAEKYGVNLEGLLTLSGSLIAASHYLKDLYKELKIYDENKPCVIIRNGKLVVPEYSTGNGRLDAAIASYNTGAKKFNKKFCKTNNPNYMAPCSEAGNKKYQPSPNDNPEIVLSVTDQEVPNYFPNYRHKKLSSTGYLKEVSTEAKKYTCIG